MYRLLQSQLNFNLPYKKSPTISVQQQLPKVSYSFFYNKTEKSTEAVSKSASMLSSHLFPHPNHAFLLIKSHAIFQDLLIFLLPERLDFLLYRHTCILRQFFYDTVRTGGKPIGICGCIFIFMAGIHIVERAPGIVRLCLPVCPCSKK